MINKVTRELINRGYNADIVTTTKNGVQFTGIALSKANANARLTPVFYKEEYWDIMPVSMIADTLEELYRNTHAPHFNGNLEDPDFLRANTKICVQPKGNEDILKRNFLDLEVYLRCSIDDGYSFKVKPEMEVEGLFECAALNTRRDTEIIKFGGVMNITTNADKLFGAGCLYCTDIFADFCKANNLKGCFIIPSSIHELILVADDDTNQQGKFDAMVKDANRDVVEDTEYLSDHAYYYSLTTNTITW